MVSHARSCPRGILALPLVVLTLFLLVSGPVALAKVEYKIETSLEGDPGDGVLSPRNLSGESAVETGDETAPATVTDPVSLPVRAPHRWPVLIGLHPSAPATVLWFDGWVLPVRGLWEGRWTDAPRSHH